MKFFKIHNSVHLSYTFTTFKYIFVINVEVQAHEL